MNLMTTLLFYVVFGTAVAIAVHFAGDASGTERWFRTLTAVLFWPLYLPALLRHEANSGPELSFRKAVTCGEPIGPDDEIYVAIQQVEAELDLALGSLDGWSDAVLAREQHRFEELRTAWHAQAQKIRELDRLLNQPHFDESTANQFAVAGERVATCERSRSENIAKLRAVRRRMHDELRNTLARVRELVTMIHLAKYTGAPPSRAEEIVVQISTAVEGLTEVAGWRELPAPILTADNLRT